MPELKKIINLMNMSMVNYGSICFKMTIKSIAFIRKKDLSQKVVQSIRQPLFCSLFGLKVKPSQVVRKRWKVAVSLEFGK